MIECEAKIQGASIWSRKPRCSNAAKIEHEGKWYCGIHSPVRKAKNARRAETRFRIEQIEREIEALGIKALQHTKDPVLREQYNSLLTERKGLRERLG
jgi:hypothetical protein